MFEWGSTLNRDTVIGVRKMFTIANICNFESFVHFCTAKLLIHLRLTSTIQYEKHFIKPTNRNMATAIRRLIVANNCRLGVAGFPRVELLYGISSAHEESSVIFFALSKNNCKSVHGVVYGDSLSHS